MGKSRYKIGFLEPKSVRSPILPPEIGAIRPENEKRYRFFLWDFFKMSLPWCLMTVLEGLRGENPLAGVCDRMLVV